MAMMRGTTSTRKLVPAIHAALPVLRRSFLAMTVASEPASFVRRMIGWLQTLAIADDCFFAIGESDVDLI